MEITIKVLEKMERDGVDFVYEEALLALVREALEAREAMQEIIALARTGLDSGSFGKNERLQNKIDSMLRVALKQALATGEGQC